MRLKCALNFQVARFLVVKGAFGTTREDRSAARSFIVKKRVVSVQERDEMDSGVLFRELLAGNPETGQPGMLDLLGLSVEKFALAIGVTRTSIYFYLTGKCLPSSKTLHRMAAVLGIPAKELFATLPTRESGAPLGGKGYPVETGTLGGPLLWKDSSQFYFFIAPTPP